jgi:plastocyanin
MSAVSSQRATSRSTLGSLAANDRGAFRGVKAGHVIEQQDRCVTRIRPIAMVLFVLAVVALVGCGSSSSSGSRKATKTATDGAITVGAYDLYFDVGTIKTTPGPLKVTLVNHGALFHTFKIEGTSLDLQTNAGKIATGRVTLTKRTYSFECTVPGHAAAGMRGKVDVG